MPSLGRLGQRRLDGRRGRREVHDLGREAVGQVVGVFGELAGVGVDDAHDRHHALLREGAPHVQGLLGGATDGHRIDIHQPGGHGAGDGRAAVDEVDDRAVLGDEHPVGVDTGADGDVGVGAQVPPLAVDRQDIRGPHHVEQVRELTGAAWPETCTLASSLCTTIAPHRVSLLMTR